MSTTSTISSTSSSAASDADLVARAGNGDLDALRAVVDRHLHPAWRIATVAAGHPERAEAATVDGIVAGLIAADRQPDSTVTAGLRVRLVGATRQVATAPGTAASTAAASADDPVVAAFLALPEKSRTALWLTEVEGGSPEQVAPVLGLDRSAAAALADRAAMALRERLASDVAARAGNDDCRNALAKLPAHAAGKLTAAERTKVGDHVGGCGSCAVWLAALVSPRPALRRLVSDPPVAILTAEIEARWVEHLKRERSGWLAPFTERAVGAAAAAVLAVGLGGVAFLGNRDDADRDRRSELAIPASVDPTSDQAAADRVTPPAAGTTATATAAAAPAAPAPARTPTVSAASSSTPQATTADDPTFPLPQPEPFPTPPPADDPPPPAPDEDTVQVTVQALQGLVNIGIGDCTGVAVFEVHSGCLPATDTDPVSITIDLPGLDPIGI